MYHDNDFSHIGFETFYEIEIQNQIPIGPSKLAIFLLNKAHNYKDPPQADEEHTGDS